MVSCQRLGGRNEREGDVDGDATVADVKKSLP